MHFKVVSPNKDEARFVTAVEKAALVALGWTDDAQKVSSPPGPVTPTPPPTVPVVPAVQPEEPTRISGLLRRGRPPKRDAE